MSKLFYKGIIEDVQSEKCTDQEVESLLAIFEYTIKHTATTLARKAWFELKDYATTKDQGIDNFTLTVERRKVNDQEQWYGTFLHGGKNLKIIGTLEKY